MVVIAEPIPTEKETHIINGLIRQLSMVVHDNPTIYNKPDKIMNTYLAGLIYEHGMKILKPIYDNIDQHPSVCIVLMGGLVKLGVIRNFFLEENRGNMLKMIQECKDFYNEYTTIDIIKKVEEECSDSTFLPSRIKHKDIQAVLENDLRILVYPIYSSIDECPMTCLALIYELIRMEKMVSIFGIEDFYSIESAVNKYKDFYINNRVKYLIERIAAHPDLGYSKDSSYEKRQCIEEILKIGEKALKPIYEIIDNYAITCTQIIPLITKSMLYKFENFGVTLDGRLKQDIQGMVKDFKNWYLSYKETHILK